MQTKHRIQSAVRIHKYDRFRYDLDMKKETIRIWYEFYKIAKNSNDAKIVAAIQSSSAHYASWGAVKNVKFDDWWKVHANLFKEQTVRQVDKNTNINPLSGSTQIQVPVKPVCPKQLLDAICDAGVDFPGVFSGLSNPKPRRLSALWRLVNSRTVLCFKKRLPL